MKNNLGLVLISVCLNRLDTSEVADQFIRSIKITHGTENKINQGNKLKNGK